MSELTKNDPIDGPLTDIELAAECRKAAWQIRREARANQFDADLFEQVADRLTQPTSVIHSETVYGVCDYLHSGRKCERCIPTIKSPYGAQVRGCFAIAKETIEVVQAALHAQPAALQPRYTCILNPMCPGEHVSKYDVCAEPAAIPGEPDLFAGEKLVPYEIRYFQSPGMAEALGYRVFAMYRRTETKESGL